MMHFTFLLSMSTHHPFVYSIRANAQQSAICSTEDPTTYKLSMSMTFKIPPWYSFCFFTNLSNFLMIPVKVSSKF